MHHEVDCRYSHRDSYTLELQQSETNKLKAEACLQSAKAAKMNVKSGASLLEAFELIDNQRLLITQCQTNATRYLRLAEDAFDDIEEAQEKQIWTLFSLK